MDTSLKNFFIDFTNELNRYSLIIPSCVAFGIGILISFKYPNITDKVFLSINFF